MGPPAGDAVIAPDQAADWVRRRLAGRGGTRWIGIDGFGAAGKTTLARRIAAGLPGARVVEVDDFARAGRPDWEHELFVETVLRPLLAGRVGRYQRWDLRTETGGDWVEVPPGGPVVVEGVSATDVRMPVPWDAILWLEVPADVRRARIAARDDPALVRRWEQDWWPSEQAYAARQSPWLRADVIVSEALAEHPGPALD